jgi:autotransporter translocation and assembly factor TamB
MFGYAHSNMDSESDPQGKPLASDGLKMQRHSNVNILVRAWHKPFAAIITLGILLGLLAGLLYYTYSTTPQATFLAATTASKVPPNSAVVAVVFKDRASLKNLRLLLESVQAKMVDGPDASGVWQVAVPKDKLKDVMKVLSESTMVDSVVLQ